MASKANHQPCAKQDTNTQLMRILISHVFTQDMTTWKHAANEYTSCVPQRHKTRWMHTADKNTNCVPQHKTHVNRRASGRANLRPRTHTTRQNMERECPNPDMNRNSRHECRDSNTTLQHETRHADERALEAAHSHKNRTWRECQGSVTKPMNDTRPKWQNPDNLRVK